MNQIAILTAAVLPILGMIAAGLFVRRFNWLSSRADAVLLRICIHFLMPALIFSSIMGNPKLREPDNLFLPPVIGFAAANVAIALAWLVGKWSGARGPAERRTFALTAGLQNYVYYALPLTTALFDSGTVGVLFVHNLGVEIVLWTVGVAVLSAQSLHQSWRRLFNPPLITLFCSLALNVAQGHLPWLAAALPADGWVVAAVRIIGRCSIPVSLILTGAIMADHLAELRGGRAAQVISTALAVKFGIVPVMYIAIARYLPCSIELKRILVIQGAMPSSMFSIVLTRRYGGDSRIAIQVVMATTIASLVLIPLWPPPGRVLRAIVTRR